jgi:diamine N-acetyltransferase
MKTANIEVGNLSLQSITFETVRTITDLEVTTNQRKYVAPNSVSLAEALFNSGAWPRAIYLGEEPVGFLMLFDPTISGAIKRGIFADSDMGLWRLMIDRRHQGKGYGRKALDLISAHARDRGKFTRLVSSYIPGPHGPEKFYLHNGFQKTGNFRANGSEIEISLNL